MKIILLNSIYLIFGFVFYYFRYQIPIECTNNIIFISFIVSIFISSISLLFFTVQALENSKDYIQKMVAVLILALIAHNFLWTMLLFAFNNTYEELEVQYPNPKNKNHKIVSQYMDEGALGGHSRKIEIYELGFGFRYIVNYIPL